MEFDPDKDKQAQLSALEAMLEPSYRTAGIDQPLVNPDFQNSVQIPLRSPSMPVPQPAPAPAVSAKRQAKPSDESSDDEMPAKPAEQPQSPQPSVADYIKQKYFGLGDDALKAAQQKADEQKASLSPWQFLSGLGDAVAHRDTSETDRFFDQRRSAIQDQNVGNLQRQKQSLIQDLQANSAFQEAQIKSDQNDPNSRQSKLVQGMVSKLYPGKFTPEQIATLTAANADSLYKPLELDAKIKENAANLAMKNEMVRQGQQDRQDKRDQADLMKLQNLAEQQRGSPAVAQAEKDLYASQKASTLVNLYGDPSKLSMPQVRLLASEIAKIASGGVPTRDELQGITPNTFTGRMSEVWSKFSNAPTPANAAAFVKQYKDYADSLAKDARQVITDKYGRVFDPYQSRFKDNTDYDALRNKYVNRFQDSAPTDHASGAAAELAKRGLK